MNIKRVITLDDYQRIIDEENFLDKEIVRFKQGIEQSEVDMKKIDKKKRQMLIRLDANRTRHRLMKSDISSNQNLLSDAKDKVKALELHLKSMIVSTNKNMNGLKNLQSAIDDQIKQVEEDVHTIEITSNDWVKRKSNHIKDCKVAKLHVAKAFTNWSSLWPALHFWLSTEQMCMQKSALSMTYLNGLVGEWRALRGIAADVKALGETTTRHGKVVRSNHISHITIGFENALRELKTTVEARNTQTIKNITLLTTENDSLEKLNKQIRILLMDLAYALEQDEMNSRSFLSRKVSESKASPGLENEAVDSSVGESFQQGHLGGASSVVGPGPHHIRTFSLGDDGESYEQYGNELHPIQGYLKNSMSMTVDYVKEQLYASHIESDPSNNQKVNIMQNMQSKIISQSVGPYVSEVSKWLKGVEVKKSSLEHAIATALGVTTPEVLLTFSSDHSAATTTGYISKVPLLGTGNFHGFLDINPDNSQCWKTKNGEEVRGSLAAFEVRSVFRELQNSIAKHQLVVSEKNLTAPPALKPIPIGQTIVLPPNEVITHEDALNHFQKTLSVAAAQKAMNAIDSSTIISSKSALSKSNKSDQDEKLKILTTSLEKMFEWLSYKKAGLHSSISTAGVFPSAPKWIFHQSTKLARGPMRKHQGGAIEMSPKANTKDLPSSKKAQARGNVEINGKLDIPQLKPFQNESVGGISAIPRFRRTSATGGGVASVSPKKVDLLSDEERDDRKNRRTMRVNTLIQKLKVTADSKYVKNLSVFPTRPDKSDAGGNVNPPRPSDMMNRTNTLAYDQINDDGNDEDNDEDMSESEDASPSSPIASVQVVIPSVVQEKQSMINLKLIAGEMASAIAQSRTKPKPGNIHRQVSVDPIAITPSGVSSKPPPTSALPISSQYSGNKSNRKFAKLRDLVNKDVEDQVITQITVRWSGEVFNVIVYWQANDEKLKINAFCFHGNEEYTITIAQSDLDLIFEGDVFMQSSPMQSPLVMQALVAQMDIEKKQRLLALEEMMNIQQLRDMMDKNKQHGLIRPDGKKSPAVTVSPVMSRSGSAPMDETDTVRVLTLRARSDNRIIQCCIAKVRNSHWENLLTSVPKVLHRENSVGAYMAKAAPKAKPDRVTVF